MQMLVLYCGEYALGTFDVERDGLELGCDPCADIVVNDPEVEARHWLIKIEGGTLVVYVVHAGGDKTLGTRFHLPLGQKLKLGRYHALLRVVSPRTTSTQTPPAHDEPLDTICVKVGQGAEARTRLLGNAPIFVGKAPDNTLVLHDTDVSEYHCRIERARSSIRVRDLGSRAGTYIRGMRVRDVFVQPGTIVRIGSTDMWLCAEVRRNGSGEVGLVGESALLKQTLAEVDRAAELPWPVLIIGESGVGKELIAARIHARSKQSTRPMVALNTGGMSRDLIESELFGHEKGAFTGALSQRHGAFERAHHSTLFLDEVGDMPLEVQVRLLRVLEGQGFYRLGGDTLITPSTRLVAATHRNLRGVVAQKRFREDLFYRLARVVIRVPALRERKEDIAVLSAHFLTNLPQALGQRHLSAGALARLKEHAWPGNIRELRNVLSHAALVSAHVALSALDIERAFAQSATAACDKTLDHETCAVALTKHQGNLSAAARSLGVPRSTLRDRIQKAKFSKSAAGQTTTDERTTDERTISAPKKLYVASSGESASNRGPLPECA